MRIFSDFRGLYYKDKTILADHTRNLCKEAKDIRPFSSKSDGRAFDEATIEAVWRKRTPEPSEGSRKDVCGASLYGSKSGG